MFPGAFYFIAEFGVGKMRKSKLSFDTFVNVPVNKRLDRRLRMAAARERISRAEFVRRAMVNYLAQAEKGVKSNAKSDD